MLAVVPDIGSSVLRLWIAAGSAALLVAACAMAFGWTQTRSVVRMSIIALGAVLGATMAWAFLNAATMRDRDAERRALETRAAQLNIQALAPGSPLACLDGLAGDNVETACEKAIFATPATVASATSYAAARLALLADMVAYAKQSGDDIDGILVPLRRALETDRFGFVAHALAVRDGCTSQNCKALALLRDASKVRANLSGETLDRYLEHHLTAWNQAPDSATANVASASPGAAGEHKIVNIDFPTAASIPPVSIMNPEPPRPGAPAAAAAAEPNSRAAAGSKSRKTAAKSAPQAAPPPPPAEAAPQVDPVWSPTTASTAPQPPAAAPQPVPAVTGPVQLNPFQAPPQASVGGTQPTQ
jgi:hypothetical protein